MDRLLARRDYLAVAKGRKVGRPSFLVQALERGTDGPARFGFTVTRKIGNAVVRNRVRRRLKEAVRLIGRSAARPGTDYVLVGRPGALGRSFDRILADLAGALAELGGRAATTTPPGAARQG
ncbi:MAG: ribonuclease P protein component [Bauldia sp.]|nr:ribonuclease P protein component [Bauldia sp.]